MKLNIITFARIGLNYQSNRSVQKINTVWHLEQRENLIFLVFADFTEKTDDDREKSKPLFTVQSLYLCFRTASWRRLTQTRLYDNEDEHTHARTRAHTHTNDTENVTVFFTQVHYRNQIWSVWSGLGEDGVTGEGGVGVGGMVSQTDRCVCMRVCACEKDRQRPILCWFLVRGGLGEMELSGSWRLLGLGGGWRERGGATSGSGLELDLKPNWLSWLEKASRGGFADQDI